MTALTQNHPAPQAISTPIVLALPKGRILAECAPLLTRAGVIPEADYTDEDSRRLRFHTSAPDLDVIR
ncbi:MAG: ATP phosphoribosyltransferase, partial [Acidocella sp.]|nr:ATP phosphoribosyltransferase [Acidocella sp.]